MDVNDNARDLQEQTAKARRLPESGNGHRRGDWPDPLIAPYELTPDQLGFLQSQVTGHRWHVGRCLSGDGDFSAACSCGWGCTETGSVGAVLRQAEEHLDAVREIRGGRPSTRAPARHEGERHSTDLLSAGAD